MISKVLVLLVVVLCVVAAGAIYQAVGARRSAGLHPPPGAVIDVDGQRLHLVRAGTGRPAVVFEAGVAASSLSWTRVMPEVAAFTHAVAYDRAGLGWSEAAQSARSVDRIVAELRGVVAGAAPAPAVLVGHSFGAFLVLVYAARHPGDVAGVVVLDPPSEWQDLDPARRGLLRRGIQASRLGGVLARLGVVRASLALLTGGAPGVTRVGIRVLGPRAVRTLEHLVGEVRKLPPDVHPAVQALWSDPKCFRAMAQHLEALGAMGDAAGRIASLGDLPLTVISAGDQPAELHAKHRALAYLSSRGKHLVARKSSHWIHLDEPDLVVTAIREVIDNHRLALSTEH
jgi:pimeloyl-ACP methyl ester carboxylesterase